MKALLAAQEQLYPDLFHRLSAAIRPLVRQGLPGSTFDSKRAEEPLDDDASEY